MRDLTLSWQTVLAEGFSSAPELLAFLQLPLELGSLDAERQFKTRIPRSFVAKMRMGDSRDPLLLQVLATPEEERDVPGYGADPLHEKEVNPLSGMIHKYAGRVLLTLTGVCAIHCRYCFRRHFPYQANNPGRSGWSAVIDYIRSDTSIHEVILSGGDPLLVKDTVLQDFLHTLTELPHVTTVRFHTRIPIVLPERIDQSFIDTLQSCSKNIVIVVHCNHPNELADDVYAACDKLRRIGCHLLNQSVLLAGINDDAEVLAALNRRLFAYGIIPYYLHVLDKVQGAAHFDVPLARAQDIFHQLQALLPGYLVPRLAREEAGKPHKTLII